MLTDLLSQSEVLKLTLINFIKLIVMVYLVFYKLPQYIFPQKYIKTPLDKIVHNILYMITSVLIVVPFLLVFGVFSYFTLILCYFLIKAFFLYYFEKRNLYKEIKQYAQKLLIKFYDFLDYIYVYIRYGKVHKEYKNLINFSNILTFSFLVNSFLIVIVICIIYNIGLINFVSISNRTTDVPIFIEWVSHLWKNQLYSPTLTIKSIGGYFFGTPVLIFFLQVITNIDITILMSLYPILLIIFVLLNIYYFVYKITHSQLAAIFSICIFGFFCISPMGKIFTGYIGYSYNPPIIEIFKSLKFYFLLHKHHIPNNVVQYNFADIPYKRLNSGLAYEIAFSFYPLYLYFLIKSFETKKNYYLILYGITLFCIFTISGAGVLILMFSSFLILLNAIFFKKIDWNLTKRGFLMIMLAGILGNLWTLSMFKYGGGLKDFGAAAPFLDIMFKTWRGIKYIKTLGIEMTIFIIFVPFQLIYYLSLVLLYPISFFLENKRRFIYSSFSLATIAILIIYLEENLGLPRFVHPFRSVEYVLLMCSIGAGIYYKFFEILLIKLFHKRYFYFSFATILSFFLISIFFVPSWNKSKTFYENSESIQYNAIALEIYKIRKLRRPLSWTLVSFVEGYSKVLGKGFHMNVSTFLEKYSPTSKFLEIPTDYVYIVLENIPNKYMGSGEWYYRWRRDLEDQLKSWITIYSFLHKNIKIFSDKEFVTIYEIDNREYMRYLYERKLKSESKSN